MRRFLADKQGATAIEYGVIVAVVVLIMLVGLTQLGNKSTGMFGNIADKAQKNM